MVNKKAIRELLDAEDELFEAEAAVEEERDFTKPDPPQAPSQVYSIRLPVDRLGELRLLAEKKQLKPAGLARQWVLERLEMEMDRRASRIVKSEGFGELTIQVPPTEEPHVSAESVMAIVTEHMRFAQIGLELTEGRNASIP